LSQEKEVEKGLGAWCVPYPVLDRWFEEETGGLDRITYNPMRFEERATGDWFPLDLDVSTKDPRTPIRNNPSSQWMAQDGEYE